MSWQKITLPNSMLISGEAHSLINSFGKMLEVFPNVNRDKVFICSRMKYGENSIIYYFSPEVVKHLNDTLSLHNSVPCEPPKWEPDDDGNGLISATGNPNVLK